MTHPTEYHSTALTPEILSSCLHAAIDDNQLASARQMIEEAFWRKLDFRPDVFHLARALDKQNKELVRLLAAYAAKLTEDQGKALTLFLHKRGLDQETLLRGTGLSLPAAPEPKPEQEALAENIETMVLRKNLKWAFDRLGFAKVVKKAEAALDPKKMSVELDADQTLEIVEGLHKSLESDKPETAEAIALLKRAKADFSKVDPNRYLGKKEPGLAWILLDAGVISAEAFDMRKLIKKLGGELKIFTAKDGKNFLYTEFTCQVSLELDDAERFIPLRRQPLADRAYQQHFCDKWVMESAPTLNYRLKGPRK